MGCFHQQHIPLGERPASADTPSTTSETIESVIPEQLPAPVAVEEVVEEKHPHVHVALEDFQVLAVLGRG